MKVDKLTKGQKRAFLIAGGLLAAFLVYRYIRSHPASPPVQQLSELVPTSSGTGTPGFSLPPSNAGVAPDPTGGGTTTTPSPPTTTPSPPTTTGTTATHDHWSIPAGFKFPDLTQMQVALGSIEQFATPAEMAQIAEAAITPGAGQFYDPTVGGVAPMPTPAGASIGTAPGDYTPGGLFVSTGGYSGAGNWQMNEPHVGDLLGFSALQQGTSVPELDLSTGQYVNTASVQPGYDPARGYTVGSVTPQPAPQVPTAGRPLGV